MISLLAFPSSQSSTRLDRIAFNSRSEVLSSFSFHVPATVDLSKNIERNHEPTSAVFAELLPTISPLSSTSVAETSASAIRKGGLHNCKPPFASCCDTIEYSITSQ